jgi:hypothetical protein
VHVLQGTKENNPIIIPVRQLLILSGKEPASAVDLFLHTIGNRLYKRLKIYKMKKLIISSVATLLLGLTATYAQNDLVMNDRSTRSVNMYKHADPKEGRELKDKSILFQFYDNGKLTKSFYSKAGEWLYTVSSYEEALLPAAVRSRVKRVYYDLAITFVDEVRAPGAGPVYRVQLQDDKKILIVKVSEDEIEVDKEYQKLP